MKFSLLKRNTMRRKLSLLLLGLAYIPAIALHRYAENISNNPFANPPVEKQEGHSRPSDYSYISRKSPFWIPKK